jgi:4-amino-4-deoxy-L-arabinose transferase-like glycosyltransferase
MTVAPNRGMSRWKTFSIILAIGILIRLSFLLSVADKPLMSDAASYNNMSLQLVSGEPFVPYWPPGLPLYLAAVHKLLGPATIAARLAMLVFYLCTSFFVYRTAALMTASRAAGNVALAFLAVSPASIHSSVEPLTQLPAAMLLTIIAYCLIRLEFEQSMATMILLAFSTAFLALVRPSSLLLLSVLPLYLLWRTRKWVPALAVILIPFVVVGAWIGYVYVRTGQFVKINTANSVNFYLGNNPYTPIYRTWWLGSHHSPPEAPIAFVQQRARIMELDATAQEAEFSRLAQEHIREHPGLFLLRSLNRICTYFAFDTLTGAYLIGNYGIPKPLGFVTIAVDAFIYILIAIGSILYFTVPRYKEASTAAFLLLGVVLLYALPYFFAFSHPSYHYPIEPLLMILSSGFFVHLVTGKSVSLRSIVTHRSALTTAAVVVFSFIQVEFLSIMMLHRM